MAEELVMWVDENEKLIKPIPISLANSDPRYLHVEVAVLIVDQKGRALIQKRAQTKKVSPGLWIITAAGHVTYGDSVDSTAHRELQEEMGIDAELYFIFKEKVLMTNESHIAHWYIGRYRGEEIEVQKEEVDEFLWISENELEAFVKNNEVSPRTVTVLKRFWSGEWNSLIQY